MLTPRFLHTRSESCDANYTPSCSTHRIVLLIIIILVGAFVGIILSLVYARNWTRNNININNTRQHSLRADSQPPSGFDLLRHEHSVLATVRFPQGRVINGRGVGEQSWRKWDEGVAAAASFEAPPPYMPRKPDAARVVALGGVRRKGRTSMKEEKKSLATAIAYCYAISVVRATLPPEEWTSIGIQLHLQYNQKLTSRI